MLIGILYTCAAGPCARACACAERGGWPKGTRRWLLGIARHGNSFESVDWQAARLQTVVKRLIGRHLLVTGLVVDLRLGLAEGRQAVWLSKFSAVWVRGKWLCQAQLCGCGDRGYKILPGCMAWQAARLQIVVTLSRLLLVVVDLDLWHTGRLVSQQGGLLAWRSRGVRRGSRVVMKKARAGAPARQTPSCCSRARRYQACRRCSCWFERVTCLPVARAQGGREVQRSRRKLLRSCRGR